jgi:hypothetical protein
MKPLLSILALALVLTAALPRVALGQVRPERPFGGLFGNQGSSDRRQSLDLSWLFVGGYDDNIGTETVAGVDPSAMMQGMFTTAGARADYRARSEHVTFGAHGATAARYYPEFHDLSAFDANTGVGLTAKLGSRVDLSTYHNFRYQPYYQFGFLTGLVPSDPKIIRNNDEVISALRSYDYDGSIGATARIDRRSSVVVDYGRRQTWFPESEERFFWQQVSARYQRGLSRNAGMRVGYGFGESQNGFGNVGTPIVNHMIDLGVDYRRALSFSRRTTFGFGSGSGLVKQNSGDYFVVNADVNLTRELGRTWRAMGEYHRGVQFVAGFADALYADTVQFRLDGLVNRRVNVNMVAGYSSGQVGLSTDSGAYSTVTASASMNYALSRWVSFDAQYFYYRYGFADTVVLPYGFAPNMNRNGIRVGLSGWLPLFR